MTLSARTPEALEHATDALADHLFDHPEVDLADVAYTLMVGRKAFEHRRAAVVDSRNNAAACESLRKRAPSTVVTGKARAHSGTKVVFMFPGQGAQVVDMGLGAYECEPRFRAEVDQCCEILQPVLGLDLRRLIYPAADQRDRAQQELQQTALTQPALFVVEYALAQLWSEWGVAPDAMIGHSLGEFVAACLAGVLSLEDALSVVAERGRLMQHADPGAMLAVPLPEAAMTPYLSRDLCLAAVNRPRRLRCLGHHRGRERPRGPAVGSGRQLAAPAYLARIPLLADAACRRAARRHDARRLLNPPRVPYLSNVTGGWITPDAATNPAYWGLQLRQTVRFADQLQELLQSTPAAVLLEVGPGRTLGDLARSHPERRSTHVIATSLAPPGRDGHDVARLLHARGTMWAHGVEHFPEGIFAHERRRRLPLPTYPFEHERYWLDVSTDEAATADGGFAPAGKDTSSFYRLDWVPSAPACHGPWQIPPLRRWLVFHDGGAVGAQVVQRLERAAHEVIQVLPGEDFEEKDSATVVIRPGQDADYVVLLKRLLDQERLPNRVAHLWGLAADPRSGPEQTTTMGFLSLVYLAQALEGLAPAPIHIDVVADGLHEVVGNEALVPAKACVLGACRVIPQEHPRITCRVIDVEPGAARGDRDSGEVEALVTELTAPVGDPVVAHRRGRRWLQTVDRVHLDPSPSQRRTRPDGVYLITGGLGRVGIVHAEYLARTGVRSLVLTGRTSLPDEADWRVLSEQRHPSTDRVRAMAHLRDLGPDVSYFCVDAAERDAMASMVMAVRETYGPINGVIHAAGEAQSYASVMETDGSVTRGQLRGKALGASVLADLVREGTIDPGELDFCMLVSSLSAILGGAGLAAYAAANCYLDALAADENRRGSVPWISVNWDAWRFGDTEQQDFAEHNRGAAIVPARGEQLLARILARAPRQVSVCSDDLAERYELWVRQPCGLATDAGANPLEEPVAVQATPVTRHRPPALDNAYLAPRTPHEQALADIWEALLGVGPIGVLDDFFELGGHSLLAIQLVSRVRHELGWDCRVQQVFDAPTIAEFAAQAAVDATDPSGDDAQRLLAAVEKLTEDEARELLSQRAPESGAPGGDFSG